MSRLARDSALIPLLLAGLVVVGGVIRFIVAGQDLFADELATYWISATKGLPDVVETVGTTAEISPPLGFVLSWFTTELGTRLSLGFSSELIRLPALVAGIATIPLVYAIGVRTVTRGAALLAAALTTLSPFMIFYSAEARGYGVMMALVLLSTLFLLLAIDGGRKRWWVGYAVAVCLAAYTHYTSVFVLGAQVAWALWAHPAARKPLLLATAAAALAYVPWLPSLKEDLDSPTTVVLSALSPFDLESIKVYLGHWTLGYPFSTNAPLRDLPGVPGLGLIAAGIVVGAIGLFRARPRLAPWFAVNDRRILLVLLLALATPLTEAFASLVGTNVFSTRNLAASWPYLALTGAALITIGSIRFRVAAAALAVAGFGFGAAQMLTTDFERPNYSDVAEFVREDPRGVLVDAAAITPGPLTNFDVEGSSPDVPVLRLNIPEQKGKPFNIADRRTEPAVLAERAVEVADGDPITVVTNEFIDDGGQAARGTTVEVTGAGALANEFIAALPPTYELAERRLFPGLVTLQALVFEQGADGGGS